MEFSQLNLTPKVTSAPFDTTHFKEPYKGPKPVVLLILDGWGIGPNNAGNAIARANTPNMKKYWISFPHTQLSASGQAVGLPVGEDGNTETGHLNIGAGSIVYQDLPRINMAISDGSFNKNEAFQKAFDHVAKNNSSLHLMGLVGAGGVHSNIEHLFSLIELCSKKKVERVYIHAFTDGRDSPPTSGTKYLAEVEKVCKKFGVGKIVSVMGRYFAMDRDKRWERIEKAYDCLTIGSENTATSVIQAVEEQYKKGVTDEFIEPTNICDIPDQKTLIQDNDAVIFFNYRIDRPRELTNAFVTPDFEKGIKEESFDPYAIKYEKSHLKKVTGTPVFKRKKIVAGLNFITMTMYDEKLPVDVAFPPQYIANPLGKVLADHGVRQLRMAETEKEKFVTYYMNGQEETIFPGESRIIIPSKGAKSYDQVPEMSAREITEHMLQQIKKSIFDVVICNFANADMVAHTGNLEASIKACEVIDECIGKIVAEVTLRGGIVMITADHGNCEELINEKTGEVDTEHSIYPVPFIIIGKQYLGRTTMLPSGILADVAPTLLSIMGIAKPENMHGRALIE